MHHPYLYLLLIMPGPWCSFISDCFAAGGKVQMAHWVLQKSWVRMQGHVQGFFLAPHCS